MAVEGAPVFDLPEAGSEEDPDKDSDKEKDKKKSKRVGEMLIESRQREKAAEKEAKPSRIEKLPEPEDVPESEAPDEEFGEAEEPVVRQQVVEIQRAINSEAEPDPDTDPAAERFLELAEQEDFESAYAQTIAELGAEDTPEEEPEETEETISEDNPEPAEEIVFDRHAFEGEDAEEPKDTVAAGGSQSPPSGLPPTQQPGPGPGGSGRRFGPPFGPSVFNPNRLPATPPSPAPEASPNMIEDRANPAAMALFGGIIGYLIGRRRGRIKAEKKLIPIQKKLEKQVENLQFDLQQKEKKIRHVAAEKVRREGPAVLEVFAKPQAAVIERKPVPGINQSVENHSHEKIGHVLISAEAKPEAKQAEKIDKKVEVTADSVAGRRIETLNRAELLSLSEKIQVEGSTLRQIYATHLVGERGLRRLITEHLRGGDLKKALRREIVEREIDFERDPAMRDIAPYSEGGAAAGGGKAGKAALSELVERATANLPANSEEAAYLRARAAYETKEYEHQQKHRRLVDISLVTTIAVLLALVALLIIERG